MIEEQVVDYTFTLSEVNIILQALAQRPYVEVAALIHNVQRIAQAKVSPQIESPSVVGQVANVGS